jgi:hypothetical protein
MTPMLDLKAKPLNSGTALLDLLNILSTEITPMQTYADGLHLRRQVTDVFLMCEAKTKQDSHSANQTAAAV